MSKTKMTLTKRINNKKGIFTMSKKPIYAWAVVDEKKNKLTISRFFGLEIYLLKRDAKINCSFGETIKKVKIIFE